MDTTQKTDSQPVFCPECESPLQLQEQLKVGTVVECTICGAQSEAVSLSPLKLSPLEEEK